MDLDTLWAVADRARERPRLIPKDVSFIRDVAPLSSAVRRLVRQRQWRFAKSTDPRIVRWALGDLAV
jgi:hypothetical protein